MPFDRFRELRYRSEAAVTGPPVPSVQEVAGPTAVAAVDLLQGRSDSPSTSNLVIHPRSGQAVERLLLGFRQVLRVTEPEETPFLQASVLYTAPCDGPRRELRSRVCRQATCQG